MAENQQIGSRLVDSALRRYAIREEITERQDKIPGTYR